MRVLVHEGKPAARRVLPLSLTSTTGWLAPHPSRARCNLARKCRGRRHRSYVSSWRPTAWLGMSDGVSGLVAAVSVPLGGCASD
jgi:hypothetical protein